MVLLLEETRRDICIEQHTVYGTMYGTCGLCTAGYRRAIAECARLPGARGILS